MNALIFAGSANSSLAEAIADKLVVDTARWLVERFPDGEFRVVIEEGVRGRDVYLVQPTSAAGIVVFAHGSGSSRLSPRNRIVATALNELGLATLLADLLTDEEELLDRVTAQYRFDISRLAMRLEEVTDWILDQPDLQELRLGYFGASTGAAAALVAAASRPDQVSEVVSRGGRPDLADDSLIGVKAPTLLIVGGDDEAVLALNRQALVALRCEKHLAVVRGATHLFDEPGTLERVARLAGDWFVTYLSLAPEELESDLDGENSRAQR